MAHLELPVRPTTRAGSGVPANTLGADGDVYIDSDSGLVYFKSSEAWSNVPISASFSLGAADTVLRMNSAGTAYEFAKLTTANLHASAGIVDTQLATISTAGKVANSATTAASANTASAIVARDGSGNFSAGTITASLSGNVTGNVTGNADTVTTNANLTGPVTSVGNATAIADGALALAKLAATTAGYFPVGADTTGVPTYVAMSGDATLASTGALTLATVTPDKGGTGVANNAAATTTRVGNYAKTETLTGITSVTYPVSGTLATTSDKLSAFAATTSLELAGVISDETGSGSLVFGTSPTIATPDINAGTADSLTSLSIRDTSAAFDVAIAAVSSVALDANRTLTVDMQNAARTLKLAGNLDLAGNLSTAGAYAVTLTATSATNITLPTTGTLATTSNKLSAFAATSSSELAGVISDETGSGALVFGTSPTIITPTIDDYLLLNEESAPSAPAAGKVAVYAKTDKKIYLKNSDGTESEVGSGSGSGEKNYITNPSAKSAITGWTASGSEIAVARTTTAGDLPREYTTGAGIKITAPAGDPTNAYVYYDFTLDDVDLSKKLKIQWAQKTTGTYAAGDLEVVITTQADRTTALHTPITTAIPSADGIFTTSFDASTTATLSLVIRATTDMATSGGIVISDVVVGPGVGVQGAVVEGWQSYTVTHTNLTASSVTNKYRRVGSSGEFSIAFTASGEMGGTVTFKLPTTPSLTIDTSALPSTDTTSVVVGSATMYDSSTGNFYPGTVIYSSTTGVTVQVDTAPTNQLWKDGVPVVWAAGDKGSITFTVPIAEWAGSGTVNLGQNDVEYASNSKSDNTATDTSSLAYGPAGSLIPNGAVGTTYARDVQFTNIQATDQFIFEVLESTAYAWLPIETRIGPFIVQNTESYGVSLSMKSATVVTVYFQPGGARPGATYGASGTPWSDCASYRWRVRKVSGGQAVGFGNATATSLGLVKGGSVPGSTSGTAIAAGYIGELVSDTPTAQTASGYNSATSCASVSLSAGVWLVTATCSGVNGTRPTGAGITSLGWDIYNSTSAAALVTQKYLALWHNTSGDGDSSYGAGALSCLVNLSASATIQLRVRCDEANAGTGTPTASSWAGGLLQAVRIA